MALLVTGCAGFIGWKVAQKLLEKGEEIVGVDNLNPYYDIRLKKWRLKTLERYPNFRFFPIDIENYPSLETLFQLFSFDTIIHEAAKAGVRYSLKDPFTYLESNVKGTLNLLELMKKYQVPKMIMASTSSLYAGSSLPYTEDLPVNFPISPYAASKKSAEIFSYTYHYLYGLNIIVVRYFTVYGPAGRPDMSIFRFIYKMLKEETIEIYGDGTQKRDFTYIEDIVEGTLKALSLSGFEIINLGSNHPYELREVLELIAHTLGKKPLVQYKEFHKADMKATWADIEKAKKLLQWEPQKTLEEGIKETISWFKEEWKWVKKISLE